MNNHLSLILFLEAFIFFSTVFFHLAKRNHTLVFVYLLQSVAVSIILFVLAEKESFSLWAPAILTLVVKGIAAPWFFFRLIKRHRITFSGTTYLNTALTLIAIFILTVLSYSEFFAPLTQLSAYPQAVALGLASMFTAFFLLINRKGAISHIIGILSLESAIVSATALLGAEGSFALELGIAFDILVWVVIAAAFLSIMYKQFGSLDVTQMKNLKE